MKKLLIALTIFVSGYSHALTLEVVPMQMRARAEVMGVHAEVNGVNAIIFAGRTALDLANAAGKTIDVGTQVIMATGREVNDLVLASLNGVNYVGRTALVTTANFTNAALDLAFGAVDMGLDLLTPPVRLLSSAARMTLNGLHAATRGAVVLVAETGVRVFRTGVQILGNIISLPLHLLNIFPGK